MNADPQIKPATGTVDWLLDGRPDLHVVYRQDKHLSEGRFNRLGDMLHAIDYGFALANLHDGMVIVAGNAAVAVEWKDRMANLVATLF